MNKATYQAKSIRTFIGAKDYTTSKEFYLALDFIATPIDDTMTLFKVNEQLGFYLQDYYVKDWVDNSMIFLEVEDVDKCWIDLKQKKLPQRFKNTRLSNIKTFEWGRECFLHDPAGVLWHFAQFNE